MKDYTGDCGVGLIQKGPPIPIEKAQAKIGFAGVAEQHLQLFLEKKGVAAPSQDLPDVQRETELKMACIAAVEPEWDEYEGLQALEAGFKITNPDLYDGLCISPSMMVEVLAASEAKAMYDYDAALSQKKARKEHMEATHAELANVYFRKPPPLEVGSER